MALIGVTVHRPVVTEDRCADSKTPGSRIPQRYEWT